MKVQSKDRRVHKLIARHLEAPAYKWQDVTDPRARRGRRWSLSALLDASFFGMLAGARSLRDVEVLTDELGALGKKHIERRVPDTTLYSLVPRLNPAELRAENRGRVRMAWRSKMLEPVGLPCGVVAIDGKGVGKLEHDAAGSAQKTNPSDGAPYWLARMLRAVLTSAASCPCLDQLPVLGKTNEMTAFRALFDDLRRYYDALFEIVTVDAGMTGRPNADLVVAAHKAYVMALKDNQPELFAEAMRLLLPRLTGAPDAASPWEPEKGKHVRRLLFRTTELAGYHGWEHLRQVWLVVRECRSPDGTLQRSQRFFLTSLTTGRLTPQQILQVVRNHWAVEDDCFWSLDVQWHEDDVPWCSQGRAVEVLGLFRIMAYNLLQLARKRHLRQRKPRGLWAAPPAWRHLFGWVIAALRLDPAPAAAVGG